MLVPETALVVVCVASQPTHFTLMVHMRIVWGLWRDYVQQFCLERPTSWISTMKCSLQNRRIFGIVWDVLVPEMAVVVVGVASQPIPFTLLVQMRIVGSCGMILFSRSISRDIKI